ncbi:MAG: GntR family transcriptional regulator [Acutalibacter sp.]|jgi:DNA-binding GntR family transcriptional regulator
MKEKISDTIYDAILKNIVTGVYTPRDFISEAQIAAQYGVSKAPVKEAMHILASEGFLVSYPKRGYMINVYTTEEMNKIQEVRRVLEALAVRKAIVSATDDELKALRFYREKKELQYRPGETVNTKFHMGIAKLAGNNFLEEALYPLLIKASVYNITGEPDAENFDHIVDAMLARDTELAVQCLIEDICFS